jgi:Protein of unknown function (DUF2939)
MVEPHRVAGSALVYAEGGHDRAWLQIANDPILGAPFKSSETATSQLAPDEDDTSLRSRKWPFAIPVLLAVMAWITWPYYAAYGLALGLRDGDVGTLETRVAWDSVRQGLRGDLSAAGAHNGRRRWSYACLRWSASSTKATASSRRRFTSRSPRFAESMMCMARASRVGSA